MRHLRNHRSRLATAFLACAIGLPGAAQAAPFATTYTGTISTTDFPEIISGQSYSVTFVFDNGGNSASNQAWTGAHLRCTFWRMNDARNVGFVQDLAISAPTLALGSATTDGAGVLTGMFTEINGDPAGASFSSTGITHTVPAHWFANGINNVFSDAAQNRSVHDASGGVQTQQLSRWSPPQPFNSPCTPALLAPSATPVPALGSTGWVLLSALLAGLGVLRRRRA
ncbi:hypothetical protein KW843_16150 [Acidovorax sp. sif1233]|uniref:hypothetical protein n=1 Tax=Acidovorax sp. sif1233 TaxID=2854792 RepID=UPI001C45DD28|nr:hypothetical protein [Acidovorax sp. sif1233]MBV7456013.1 hypothetical protein [Acidovorax sp. sif1233]